MKKLLLFTFLFLSFSSCENKKKKEKLTGTIAKNAMVVSARKEASIIGLEILKKGGNAFDAMVATELALAVAYPCAGNLGGGGFMVYRKADGTIGALDYREKAPLAAHKEMYLNEEGNIISKKSTLGAMAIGIPGTIAGIFAVHEKFGTLPIKDIIQPVINLARKGVIVTQKQRNRIKNYQSEFKKANKDSILLSKDWKENDLIVNNSLANTLERIQKNGRDEFYKGKTAEIIVRFIQENGGIITLEDLQKYEVKWRNSITFSYDELKIISMSPPSSGGICLAQIMKMIEPFDLKTFGHNSVKMIQVLAEAERRSYADRSFFLGDPDFVNIPDSQLLSEEYLNRRMKDFSFKKATKSEAINHGNIQIVESEETTHYAIIDAFGNAISATTTINGAYGSKLYSNELGFFFNNEMDDFSAKPGEPNMFGLVGAEANAIIPEKRMLSSMTPTIIEKNDKLWMVLGTPGGSTIITSVLQTILNIHEYGMGAQEAVNQARFHHQWLPDAIMMEQNGFPQKIMQKLIELGYLLDTNKLPVIGKVKVILVRPDNSLEGGADPRGDDKAIGF